MGRMAYYSSPEGKKGGAGGPFTWGGAMDVTDYAPLGPGTTTSVTLAPASLAVPVPDAAAQNFQLQPAEFPVLGAGGPSPAMPLTAWGPGTLPSTTVIMSQEGLQRPSGAELVDAQHPRNRYLKRPHHGHPLVVTDYACGSAKESRIRDALYGHNPAHLSPHARPTSTEFFPQATPKVQYEPPRPPPPAKVSASRRGPPPRLVIKQPQGRL